MIFHIYSTLVILYSGSRQNKNDYSATKNAGNKKNVRVNKTVTIENIRSWAKLPCVATAEN